MALFDRLKNMLQKEDRTKEIDVSLKHDKMSSEEIDRSICKSVSGDLKSDKQGLVSMLTPREKDLYHLLLEGYTLKEAAMELSVKYSTVNTHMTAIYKKLKINSRAELIIKYRGVENS